MFDATEAQILEKTSLENLQRCIRSVEDGERPDLFGLRNGTTNETDEGDSSYQGSTEEENSPEDIMYTDATREEKVEDLSFMPVEIPGIVTPSLSQEWKVWLTVGGKTKSFGGQHIHPSLFTNSTKNGEPIIPVGVHIISPLDAFNCFFSGRISSLSCS